MTEKSYPEICGGKNKIEFILNNTANYCNDRKVVIWGNYKPSREISEKLREQYAIDTAFYVDTEPAKANGTDCFLPDVLSGKADEYYVVVPLRVYDTIKKALNEYGYVRNKDYYYFSDCTVIRDEAGYYEDAHGNRIVGIAGGAQISFMGCNALVEIGSNALFCKTEILMWGDSTMQICDFCEMNDVIIRVRDGAQCSIGSNTKMNGMDMNLCENALWKNGNGCDFKWRYRKNFNNIFVCKDTKCIIGERCSFQYGLTFYLYANSLIIGDDCMFSHDVEVRNNDGHSIFDIVSGKNISSTPEISRSRKIEIGRHVWVCARVFILYNTVIGDGAVIGAESLVKGYVPNNSIAAGTPARVIRENIAWAKRFGSDNILDCGEEYINLTEYEM
jgi:acetyltransferase-like isoleucine patch superfamily enzyme